MKNDFAAFILSHGRPENVYTVNTLKKCGYTGDFFIVIDDEDASGNGYRKKYGKKVIVFNKKEIADKTDEGDNFDNRRTTTHARNAIFEIATRLGYKYFLALDDDYTDFVYKFNSSDKYQERRILGLDKLFGFFCNYLENSGATSVAMAQNGDFIGGAASGFAKKIKPKRKCMNTFFCATSRPFVFFSRLNEDVNTYMSLGNRGHLFMTIPQVAIIQKQTQSTKGGMTDAYIDGGTYVKSFYTVMYCPSFCKVAMMGDKHKRIHHRISWRHAVPVILSESYKKGAKTGTKQG
jgi:hypothetical protein